MPRYKPMTASSVTRAFEVLVSAAALLQPKGIRCSPTSITTVVWQRSENPVRLVYLDETVYVRLSLIVRENDGWEAVGTYL